MSRGAFRTRFSRVARASFVAWLSFGSLFYSRKYTYPNGDSYEAGDTQPFTFTLGSYASFLRNLTKNIQYDYRAHAGHYVMGFVYTRNDNSEEGLVKDHADREEVPPPYEDVEYFVSEKYEIAGVTPGSWNTENIGSFRTNDIEDLRDGNGPFAEHGEDLFEEYWRNHGRYREEDEFSSLEEFFEWREDNNESTTEDESEDGERTLGDFS